MDAPFPGNLEKYGGVFKENVNNVDRFIGIPCANKKWQF